MKKIPYSPCVLCMAFFVLLLFFLFLSTQSTHFAPSSWAQDVPIETTCSNNDAYYFAEQALQHKRTNDPRMDCIKENP